LLLSSCARCVCYHGAMLLRYKGKAAVGSVPSMEKVYHLLVAGTIKPDDKGVSLSLPLHVCKVSKISKIYLSSARQRARVLRQ